MAGAATPDGIPVALAVLGLGALVSRVVRALCDRTVEVAW